MGIVHRDLKMDNIMLLNANSKDERDLQVRVIDFGMSKLKQGNKKIVLSSYAGTVDFMAPEIINGDDYGEKCDMWSIGVIAFMLMGGVVPFEGKDDQDTIRRIQSCNYEFKEQDWQGVSREA